MIYRSWHNEIRRLEKIWRSYHSEVMGLDFKRLSKFFLTILASISIILY